MFGQKAGNRAKRIGSALLAAALAFGSMPTMARANGDAQAGDAGLFAPAAKERAAEQGFVLYDGTETAPILMDASYASDTDAYAARSYAQVARAANDLRQDVGMVTGAIDYREIQQIFDDDADKQVQRLEQADADRVPALLTELPEGQTVENAVIIGTVSGSPIIQQMMQEGKLEAAKEIEGQWESYVIEEVEQPIDGVENALVIAGSDARGTIYGIYTVSEEIGVSPFYWYSDVPVEVQDEIIIGGMDKTPVVNEGPDVKYRGIFINDEDISILNWAAKKFSDGKAPGVNYYRHVFELLLRLKCNALWPAMHEVSAAFCTEKNAEGVPVDSVEAAKYGIVIGSSHCDILLRTNTTEWAGWYQANKNKYQIQGSDSYDAYDFTKNENAILQYWRERLETNKDFESILTLGIRGVHDGAFNCDNLSKYAGSNDSERKVSFMEDVIKKQRKLIAEVYFDGDIERVDEVPQVLIPYKEMGTVYNNGLNEFVARKEYRDITLMWAEDNFGYVRQTPTADEAARTGGTGIYYHSSYYGTPSCYLWLNSMPLAQMSEQLHRAYNTGMRNQWILNVGDIKPGDQSLEFYAKMSWDMDTYNDATVKAMYLVPQAMRDFGMDKETAERTAAVMQEYYSIIAAKKPEFYTLGSGANPFSTTSNGDEALLWAARCQKAAKQMTEIYESLQPEYQTAFYEQAYYHVLSMRDAAEEYIYYWKALQAVEQGRAGSAQIYIELSKEARDRIQAGITEYGSVNGGKWKGYMSWQHVGGSGKDDFNHDLLKDSEYPSVNVTGTGVGAAAENQETAGSGTLSFNSMSDDTRYFDVFSRELEMNGWAAEASEDWIQMSASSGVTMVEERVKVTVDWSKVTGSRTGTISVYNADEKGGKTGEPVAVFEVKAVNKGSFDYGSTKGYVEANGYVMIEAEDYSENIPGSDGSQWTEIQNNGQRGNTMKAMPDTAAYTENFTDTAKLVYNVYFEKAGTYQGTLYRLPTLNEGKDSDGRTRTCRSAIGANGGTPTWLRGKSSWEADYNYNSPGNVWSSNIMRMYEPLDFSVTVKEGWNQIIVYRMETSIVFDRILIETQEGAAGDSLLGPVESPNNISGNAAVQVAELPDEIARALVRPNMTLSVGDGTVVYTGQEQVSSAVSKDERVAKASVDGGRLYITPCRAGTASIQAECEEGNFTFQVTVTPDASRSGAYVEKDGIVVIQAGDAASGTADAAASGSSSGHTWALSGIGIQVQPDTGSKWTDGSVGALEGNAPSLTWKVKIIQEGDYRIYVNTSNPNADGDSYHLVTDGAFRYTDTNGSAGTATGHETWYGGNEAISLTEGIHTIQIYAREDGFRINQVVITTGEKPSGIYAEGSLREDDADQPPVIPEDKDKELLRTVMDAYRALDTEAYTDESVGAFRDALEAAEKLLEQTEVSGDEAWQAASEIIRAAAGLTLDTSDLDAEKQAAEAAKEAAQKAEEAAKKAAEQYAGALKDLDAEKEKLAELEEAAAKKQAELDRLIKEAKEQKDGLVKLQKELEAQKAELERRMAAAGTGTESPAEPEDTFTSKKVSIKGAKSLKKKQVRLTWKAVEGAEGYVIQYASNAKFKSARKATVRKGTAVKKVIKKLKGGKTYYFRVRAYKTTDGRKVYTKYSSRRKAKVK